MPLLILASFINVFLLVTLKATSLGASIFIFFWLTSPYILLGYFYRKGNSQSKKKKIVTWLIVFGGLAMHMDIIFIRPDAQGALGVFMVPILQFIVAVVCIPFFLGDGNENPIQFDK